MISPWLSEDGIDRVDNFRILKGFPTHSSFWNHFNNVVGRQSAIPLGSMSDVNINTGSVATLSHRLITDVLPGRQYRRADPIFQAQKSFRAVTFI